MSPIRQILVATDFSECSRAAVGFAAGLAQKLHAKLTLLHVWEITPLVAVGLEYAMSDVVVTSIQKTARAELEMEIAQVRRSVPDVESKLCGGIAWEEIVRIAKESSVDLIVIGTHGRTGLSRLALGSIADRVVRSSPIPVVTVRQPKEKT